MSEGMVAFLGISSAIGFLILQNVRARMAYLRVEMERIAGKGTAKRGQPQGREGGKERGILQLAKRWQKNAMTATPLLLLICAVTDCMELFLIATFITFAVGSAAELVLSVRRARKELDLPRAY